jgi:hypothetical protein
VNVPDIELVVLLEDRDGPLPERSWSHASEGECRYAELYDGQPCPWCEADRRRREREAAGA